MAEPTALDGDIPSPSPRWREPALLALVFLAAFILRLWGISHAHGWDENVYLQNAELICCGKTNYNEIDSRPPLLSLLFAAAFKLWHSDYAAYLVTALLNALGPVFLYLAGRLFVGRRAAAIAGLLLAFTPFYVSVFPPTFVTMVTGHGLLSDSPTLTLLLLAFWLLLRGLEKDSAREFTAAGLVLALSVLMRFPALSSVGILALLALAAPRKLRAVAALALGFTLGMVPYLIWSRWQYGGFLATFLSGWDNFSGPGQSPFFYLQNSATIFGWVTLLGLLLWVASRLARLIREHRPPAWREAYLCLWAIALLLCFSLLHHKEPRYAMPAAPPLFLLAGLGLATLTRAPTRPLRIAGTATLAAILLCGFWPSRHRFDGPFVDHTVSEEMRVSAFLTATLPPHNVVYANFSYPDFGFYTSLPIEVLPEDGWGLYKTLNELPDHAALVAYKTFEGHPPEPSLAWLDANPHYTRIGEFPTMVIYRFATSSAPTPPAPTSPPPAPSR
jgi:4-amino-4-deoxy-L-arabinose transferase-like glycosyltransferase